MTVAQQNDEAVAHAGEQVYRRLLDAGADVIIDDRPARAGEKFSDAELVGIPLRVTIGKRGLASGTAEVTERATGETTSVPLDEIAEHVCKAVADVHRHQPLEESAARSHPLPGAGLSFTYYCSRSLAWQRRLRSTSSRPSMSRRCSAAGGLLAAI